MLRKNVWLDLVEGIPELCCFIKENIRIQYVRNIFLKVVQEKKNFLKNYKANKSNKQVISVHNVDDGNSQNIMRSALKSYTSSS